MRHATGFTLVELMVVVAIIAILATIAYPSYQSQLYKSRRVDGQAALLDLAQQFERCYTEGSRYTHANCPTGFPLTSAEGYYAMTTAVLTESAFTLVATPQGAQQGDGRCTTLTLSHSGIKGATGSAVSECW